MLYTFQANVFNKRIGSKFGRIINITISARNKKDAYEQAKTIFNKYINNLYKRCYMDVNGKMSETINPFSYNNLKML